MNINKDNNSNKGVGISGQPGKNGSSTLETTRILWGKPRDNFLKIGGKVGLSQGLAKGWGKAVVIPKVFPKPQQGEFQQSTFYPQLIHRTLGKEGTL